MYYCFIKEDLDMIQENEPLFLQAVYAKRLGKFLCLDIQQRCVTDQYGAKQNVQGELVFLRSTCWFMENGITALEKLGAKLIETKSDVECIENWALFRLTKREIFSVTYKEILEGIFSQELELYLKRVTRIFIKSKKKGYCVQMSSGRLLEPDEEIRKFFEGFMDDIYEELLLTEELVVIADSLGNKESRHIVIDGQIINSSRTLHSLKHAVPKTLLLKAEEVVSQISQIETFPQNYVLDVGMFEKDGEIFADIVEINPLTTSLCYVNNSIFKEEAEEIQMLKTKWNMGAEYLYDMFKHPISYVEARRFGEHYSYLNEEHYELK